MKLPKVSFNSGFAKKRLQWLIEHSTSHQILWYVDSLLLRNPLLRKAVKRVWLESITHETSNWMLFDWWKKLIQINWPSAEVLPGKLANRHVLLLMKISGRERQGLKGQRKSVPVRPNWAERKWTFRWSLERARRWAKQVVTFASAI